MKVNIAVGSTNPVKINAARAGFLKLYIDLSPADINFVNFPVSSGVRDQPFGDSETMNGAKNRATQAYRDFSVKHDGIFPNYSIGIEGGLAWTDHGLECFAWTVIYDGERIGQSRSASFFLPESLAIHVQAGMELGPADDLVFGRSNSKQGSGTVGHLTNGIIHRSEYYEQTVVLAFIPFLQPTMFPLRLSSSPEKAAVTDVAVSK